MASITANKTVNRSKEKTDAVVSSTGQMNLTLPVANDDHQLSGTLDVPEILKIVVDNISERVMVLDSGGHYVYINPAVARLYAASEREIIGSHLSQHLSLKEINRHAQLNLEKCINGETISINSWRLDPNGQRVFLDVRWFPYFDANTARPYAVVVVCDQTSEKISKIALSKTHKQLKDYLTASSDWLWETDSSHRFSWISDSVSSKHKLRPQTLLNQRIEDVFVPCDAETSIVELSSDDFKPAPIRDLDVDLIYDNIKARIQISCIPMFDHSGKFNGFRGSVREVSELRAMQDQAVLANRRFVQAIDSFNGSFALFDDEEKLVNYNQTYREIHSFLGDELKPGLTFERCLRIQIEKGIIQTEPDDDDTWIAKRIKQFRNPKGPFIISKANNKWYRVTEHRLEDGGCFKTMEDISEMKNVELALRDSEQRFKDFAETAADWFWEMDEELKLNYISDRYDELTGQPSEEILGQCATTTRALFMSDSDRQIFDTALHNHERFEDIQITFKPDTDEVRYFSLNGRPRFSEDNEFLGFRGVARNVTHAVQLSDQLNHQAHYDPLTGLMNRREFNHQLMNARTENDNDGVPFVLGFLDLDQFKIVNDSEGHLAGDRLLQEVSVLFKQQLYESDVLARLGGDEFGMLMKNCRIDEALERSNRILHALKAYRFGINDKTYGMSTSIGLVEVSDSHLGIDELLRRADIACFAAKDLGRNQVHVYESNDEESRQLNQAILHAAGIEQAIANDEFTLFVQPIAQIKQSEITISHYEILLRMQVGNSVILPGAFIPVAERFRLMGNIDRWVVRKSFEQIKSFDGTNESEQPCRFTINLSGASLTDASFADYICEQLSAQGVDPRRICFEITETAVVSNFEKASQFVEQLRETGVLFALDDFGSGMSSFAYLKQFEVDYLKIDGSLITDITENIAGRTMVSAINQMAHVLGMKTVAEFVENERAIEVLSELGIDMLQGYAIGRPRPML